MPRINLFILLAPVMALALNGCVGAIVEGGSTGKDVGQREFLEESARAGDSKAQYGLGESYCCRVGPKMGIYDNEKATSWMCKSAAQGYGHAAYRLAEIYSGRPFTYRLMRRLITAVMGAPKNMPVALAWAQRAKADRYEDAESLVEKLRKSATRAERARAAALLEGGHLPCLWHEVIGRD